MIVGTDSVARWFGVRGWGFPACWRGNKERNTHLEGKGFEVVSCGHVKGFFGIKDKEVMRVPTPARKTRRWHVLFQTSLKVFLPRVLKWGTPIVYDLWGRRERAHRVECGDDLVDFKWHQIAGVAAGGDRGRGVIDTHDLPPGVFAARVFLGLDSGGDMFGEFLFAGRRDPSRECCCKGGTE